MVQLSWSNLRSISAIFATAFLFGQNSASAQIQPNASISTSEQRNPAQAQPGNNSETLIENIRQYSNLETSNTESMSQVTNVNQLRDVSPTDWAYEALRSLVDRYGCIAGFPNQTYRGSQPLTRYEFAAGLNSCLNQIERLIASNESVSQEDLESMQRLAQEFEAELATLGGRVDEIESRTAVLEDNQFSTTTKLNGTVIFNAGGAFGSELQADSDVALEDEFTLSYRTRLNFDTSFMGEDRLRVRLQAGNFNSFADATGTDMARLAFDDSSENSIEINDLSYRFPLGDNIRIWLGANGTDLNDFGDIHNPYLESTDTGSLNRFFNYNPFIFRTGAQQAIGANVKFTDSLGLDLAYLTGDAEEPSETNGLFNGDYTAIGQLNWKPIESLSLGLAGGYSYYPGDDVNLSGSTGSSIARQPFGEIPTSAIRAGVQGSWEINSKLNLAAWGGYINAEAKDDFRDGDNADLWNWVASLSLLDLGKEGAIFTVAGGMPPKATDVDGGTADLDTSYIIEAQYKFPLSENILITPGAYVILNPNHNENNDSIWVGAIRTNFSF
ncbi:cyanobacterial porin (plasmid) [Stanieria cyanosphaera PCC 7437]|uniref:Cyanobacterial porin n=1 Tax=Stanieria cyanosphaera (strain ATCC 29371 / PCC 7437) TaxID=111780 RepID=K9Y1J8_STAC7|nr:iron uptake porin [Stanieria cyanosphaera]AFZ38204.1 cyanobacterial porin [Stanieria cyanosphaera PCC 7437]